MKAKSNLSTLLVLEDSKISRDLLSTLSSDERQRVTLLITEETLYNDILSESNQYKQVINLSKQSRSQLELTLQEIKVEDIDSALLLLMNLDKLNSNIEDKDNLEDLLHRGVYDNIILASYLKKLVSKSQGKLILPLYYYRTDTFAKSSLLYSSLYSAIESFFLGIKSSLYRDNSSAQLLYLKSPNQYKEGKYKDVLSLLKYEIFKSR